MRWLLKIITNRATSAVFQEHRLRKVRTMLIYAKGEVAYKDDINRVLEYTDYFKGRYLETAPSFPTPISREAFDYVPTVVEGW